MLHTFLFSALFEYLNNEEYAMVHMFEKTKCKKIKIKSKEQCYSGIEYRNDPKFSDRCAWANSADPDQTAPRGAV